MTDNSKEMKHISQWRKNYSINGVKMDQILIF